MFPQFTVMLLLAVALPQAELERFAARVAQTAAAAGAGTRAALRVEDAGATGAGDQVSRALQDALRQRGIETLGQGNAALQITAYLSLRTGHPLVAARVLNDGREAATLLAEFAPPETATAMSAAAAVTVRTRTLLITDSPVLDVDADSTGNLFVLHAGALRAYDLNASTPSLKTEVGLDTGADRLRDPLVRLVLNEAEKRLEIYTAATAVAQPPMLVGSYTLKSFAAPARLPGPVTLAAGRNHFRSPAVPEVYGITALPGGGRAQWALLDGRGRVRLADTELRPLAVAPGEYGGDVAAVTAPCAGTLVLVAGDEIDPARDRITLLRLDNDRLTPYSAVEIDGAVTRLKTLSSGKILAVTPQRIDELEVRCTP